MADKHPERNAEIVRLRREGWSTSDLRHHRNVDELLEDRAS